jgi:hypothetical protein
MANPPEAQPALLTVFLANSDARCLVCHYALRGCASDKCPECGCELALEIASPRTMSGWWLAGVMGLSFSAAMAFCMMFGMGGWIAYSMQHPGLRGQARAGFASSAELPRWMAILALTALLVVITLALASLASRRRQFLRMENPRRACLGLFAAIYPLLTLAVIALLAPRQ